MLSAHIFLALISTTIPAWCNQEPVANVNSRYTIEGVELSPRAESKLSNPLKADIKRLIGEKFNQESVDSLVRRIRKELRGYKVVQRIAKGAKPENVRVLFDIVRARRDQDIVLPRLAYNSRQNFTFGADANFDIDGGHQLNFGLLSDNNELLERYSGIRGGYRRTFANGRFRGGFLVESWRAQWNGAVQTALAQQREGNAETVPGIYRTRFHAQPEVSIEILPGIVFSAGISFQRLQTQFPAARTEGSHALITSLRLGHDWELSNSGKHLVEAGYSLRAATHSLGSDFAYSRHAFDAHYRFRLGPDSINATFLAGTMNGPAPLFERFILGNANTLRGYNKYDVAPLGGNRMAHGSLDYRHSWVRAVYDTGVVYTRGGEQKVRHSLAAGLVTGHKKDSFSFLVAFPLKDGRAEPIFILGMNF